MYCSDYSLFFTWAHGFILSAFYVSTFGMPRLHLALPLNSNEFDMM